MVVRNIFKVSAALTQVSIHCNFLHKFRFDGVAWLSPEVGIKFGIRLADHKMRLPIALVYLHNKNTCE